MGYQRARGIIEQTSAGLVRIAQALLEREVLDGAELKQLINRETLAPTRYGNDNRSQAAKPESGLRVPPLVDGPQPA